MSQGVPFYHSSLVEKLRTVGLHHRSRTLPGMRRTRAAHPWGPGSPESQTLNPAPKYWITCLKIAMRCCADDSVGVCMPHGRGQHARGWRRHCNFATALKTLKPYTLHPNLRISLSCVGSFTNELYAMAFRTLPDGETKTAHTFSSFCPSDGNFERSMAVSLLQGGLGE